MTQRNNREAELKLGELAHILFREKFFSKTNFNSTAKTDV